ncbi:MAG: DUF4912 domain-containing protein [Chthoniobacterales bacterium]|nr:DUF4912 domain-containing protein [Chthoniobacterales bacterium]
MKESDSSATEKDAAPEGGFQVSRHPLVGTPDAELSSRRERDDLPDSYGTDLFYVIARDPHSLFLYWDLDWKRLFSAAGLSPHQVHVRIYREDGAVEATREINPFRGHSYVDVADAGTSYYCDLGCFEGSDWRKLARSGTTATPEAAMSDDLSADFATLPIHLSFQRMLDIFRATTDGTALASSVSQFQERSRLLQQTSPDDWSRWVAGTTTNGGSRNGDHHAAAIAALLEAARQAETRTAPTAEQIAQWKELGERFGGSSWGGASDNGFGGSSPA